MTFAPHMDDRCTRNDRPESNDPRTESNCYHGVAYVSDNRFATLALYGGVPDND